MNESSPSSMTIAAPAKLNLHLEVLGKRPDGFHEIESLMVTISLADELRFVARGEGTTLICDEKQAGPVESNLVYRAVELVRRETGRQDGLEITLTKQIPIGAGMGGGSSDAASTLIALNQWWRLGWDRELLTTHGAELGSDVPYFFYGPAAIVRGRGEIVTPWTIGRRLDFVVVAPNEHLGTREIFARVTVPKSPVAIDDIAEDLAQGRINELAGRLHNRLQPASLDISASVRRIHEDADTWPCLGHLMTGSGSAYFALCESTEQAERLGQSLSDKNLGNIYIVQSG